MTAPTSERWRSRWQSQADAERYVRALPADKQAGMAEKLGLELQARPVLSPSVENRAPTQVIRSLEFASAPGSLCLILPYPPSLNRSAKIMACLKKPRCLPESTGLPMSRPEIFTSGLPSICAGVGNSTSISLNARSITTQDCNPLGINMELRHSSSTFLNSLSQELTCLRLNRNTLTSTMQLRTGCSTTSSPLLVALLEQRAHPRSDRRSPMGSRAEKYRPNRARRCVRPNLGSSKTLPIRQKSLRPIAGRSSAPSLSRRRRYGAN
jgi:hypothetical protein